MSHKARTSEAFEDINQVLLDVISDNIASLVQSGKHGALNKIDTFQEHRKPLIEYRGTGIVVLNALVKSK